MKRIKLLALTICAFNKCCAPAAATAACGMKCCTDAKATCATCPVCSAKK